MDKPSLNQHKESKMWKNGAEMYTIIYNALCCGWTWITYWIAQFKPSVLFMGYSLWEWDHQQWEAAASALENETALTSFQPTDPEPEAAKLLFCFWEGGEKNQPLAAHCNVYLLWKSQVANTEQLKTCDTLQVVPNVLVKKDELWWSRYYTDGKQSKEK